MSIAQIVDNSPNHKTSALFEIMSFVFCYFRAFDDFLTCEQTNLGSCDQARLDGIEEVRNNATQKFNFSAPYFCDESKTFYFFSTIH